MKKCFCFIIIVFFSFYSFSQNKELKRGQINAKSINDTTKLLKKKFKKTKKKSTKAIIEDYKIISFKNDTTYVDTTLSIKKDYKFNYLRKDNFNLISFSNIGQTYNTLSYSFENNNSLPLFGARASHFNYMEIEDINYFNVPTPFTELMYKSAFEQGQLLDAFFTVNTSDQFNFSIAYKGLRSLGKYQNILTSTGNFRFTANYHTKNKRYKFKIHFVNQDLLNEENGGLRDEDIINFESGAEEFIDRSVFDPNFENAENILNGNRIYFDQEYLITSPKDSVRNNFSIQNKISFEDKNYKFNQTSSNEDFFGEAFANSISDRVSLENFNTSLIAKYSNNIVGNFGFMLNYSDYNYGYDTVVIIDNQFIRNRLKGNIFALGSTYSNKFNKLNVEGEFGMNITGDFDSYFVNASAEYRFNDENTLNIAFNSNSSPPNYNYLLFQSDYINYNWDNFDEYQNIETQQLLVNINSKKWANLSIDISNIKNYSYFTKDTLTNGVKPNQFNNSINYLKLKLNKEIRYKKFALDNTLLYQNVINGSEVFKVPNFVTRNTLYYSNHFFKKALFLQTGITFNYFSKYSMNAYDPLLSEFYVQNNTKIGGFPRFDFFINAKIRQTRIFLKAEHFNSSFTGYNYYSAPNYPFRDFAVRFGIVWNFFL